VEWLLNRTADGWLVGLFNPAGNTRLQHGVGPTDYRQERAVVIRSAAKVVTASEWFTGTALPRRSDGRQNEFQITVPAGGVRIVELTSN
jgi:hypothetical protein